jgi:fibronectin type 3 domain-containing protein
MSTSRFCIKRLLIVLFLFILGPISDPAIAEGADAPTFNDDFNGATLGQTWTTLDGYELANPGDLANHAIFSMTGSQLSIAFPGGVEHNMWWLRHAQVTRTYQGSGVYEIKVDSSLDGSQQFGLIFENGPGTFLIFMLYAHDAIWGYVERFANVNGVQYKTTFPGPWIDGHNTGKVVPDLGPYWLRVIVNDAPVLTDRQWRFEWSSDGTTWTTIVDGVLEGPESSSNIGAINRVGLFAGNQPYEYSAFNARFDYYRTYPISALPVQGPSNLAATPGNQQAKLVWDDVGGTEGYSVYRSVTPGGPYSFIGTSTVSTYTDSGLTNGTLYAYVVAAHVNGVQSLYSNEAKAIPHALQNPGGLPSNGRIITLTADDLGYLLFNGEAVTHWPDALGNPIAASAQSANAPTFVASAIAGRGAVRFDGQNDHLSLPGGFEDFSTGMTLFVVARPTSVQAGSKLVLLGNGAGQGNVALGRNGSGAGLQYFTNDGAGNYGWFGTANALASNEAALYAVVQSGGAVNSLVTATVSKNGEVVGSDSVYVPPVGPRVVNYIGRSYWASDGYFAGDISEIIVYNRTLSTAEQTAVSSYLANKYDLTIVTPTPPPLLNPPGAVSATAGNAQISLNWSVVAGATGYKIYRRATPSGAFTQIYQGVSTGFLDAGVVNGTTYRYVATAYDANQESAYSIEIVITPMPPALNSPGAPSAAAGNTQVSLSWNGVMGATGYKLYRRATSGGSYAKIYEGVGLTFNDTGLTNGTTYGYVVAAYDAFQTSPYSPEVLVTPAPPPVLVPPEDIPEDGLVLLLDAGNAALSATNGSQVMTWRDASGQGYDAVTVSGQAPTLMTGAMGGGAALRFDGQNDYLSLAGGFEDFSTGMTLFVVARPTVLQAGSKLVLLGNGAGQENVALGRNGDSAGLQYFTTDSAGSYEWFATADALTTNEPSMYSVVQGGGPVNSLVTATVSKNGEVVGSDSVYVPPVGPRVVNYIGRSYWGSDGYFAGDIAEIILYNRTLNAAEQTSVSSYLANKYGLAINTPAPPPVLVPPEEIPEDGLVLLLDAGNAALSATNGSPVTTWRDASGQGYDAITVSGQAPTLMTGAIGGGAALRFDGQDDHLNLPGGFEDFRTGMTLFVVARPTALQAGSKLVLLGNGAGQENVALGRNGGSAGLQYFTTDSAGSYGWFATADALSTNLPAVYSVVQGAGAVNSFVTATVSKNGEVVGSDSVYVPPVGPRVVNYIGRSYWGSDGYFAGDIAEIILYNRTLSIAEQNDVITYLANKYNIDLP